MNDMLLITEQLNRDQSRPFCLMLVDDGAFLKLEGLLSWLNILSLASGHQKSKSFIQDQKNLTLYREKGFFDIDDVLLFVMVTFHNVTTKSKHVSHDFNVTSFKVMKTSFGSHYDVTAPSITRLQFKIRSCNV